MSAAIIDRTDRLSRASAAWLRDHLERAADVLEVSGDVSVAVLADDAMSDAHLRFRGIAGTTDVLTFDYRESAGGDLDAELLLCLDEAERRGRELGHGADRELLLYAVHGLLHCLGHDDGDDDAAAWMHAEEDRVLSAIGVGPVFRSAGGAT